MSELTQQEREKLAFFMGWKRGATSWWADDGSGEYRIDASLNRNWKPDQNIEQAFMLLDKFDVWNIRKEEMILEPYSVDVFYDDRWWYKDGDILSLAICRAVLAAIE